MTEVLCDVSFLAMPSGHQSTITGVGRVINELLSRAEKFSDMRFYTVCCFDGDWNPIWSDNCAKQFLHRQIFIKIQHCDTIKRSNALVEGLRRTQLRLEHLRYDSSKSREHWLGTLLRPIRKLNKAFVTRTVNSQSGVFFSPFYAPPEWLPDHMPRVVLIYDVYPLRNPSEASPDNVAMLRKIIAGLNSKRDRVVAISEFTKQDFCEVSRFPANRVSVAHLGADHCFRKIHDEPIKREFRRAYRLPESKIALLVANIQPRKNLPFLLNCVREIVQKSESPPHFVIAGKGNADVTLMLEKFELSKIVQLLGQIPEQDLPVLYNCAEVLVFPSLYEGFGLPALEAMQCGTPVICSNCTSLPEVVGDAALTFEPNNKPQFISALTTLLDDRELQRVYSMRGIERAKCFSWDKMAESVRQALVDASTYDAGSKGRH